MSSCPNGHKGGLFCCEDYVNIWARIVMRKAEARVYDEPMCYVTLAQFEAYGKILRGEGEECQRTSVK